jgi:hypothetical protein
MSEHLDRLHAAAHRRGQSYEAAAAAWAAYKEYARHVADGLPFPYRLEICDNPTMRPSTHNEQTHIILQAAFSTGRMIRIPGDALCKPRWKFNRHLSDVQPNEAGATCHDCIEIAERLSIVEFQAS